MKKKKKKKKEKKKTKARKLQYRNQKNKNAEWRRKKGLCTFYNFNTKENTFVVFVSYN